MSALIPYGAFENNVTISGFSMGAFMTTELGVIYSSKFSGLGVVGGGVYGLSDLDASNKPLDDNALAAKAEIIVQNNFNNGEIDDPQNLKK